LQLNAKSVGRTEERRADTEGKMLGRWKYLGHCCDGEPFRIDDVNVWSEKWEQVAEQASVVEPVYGQHFTFNVYEIRTAERVIRFAAGEFSANVYGFYTAEVT
jgi:hypothetical protein